jgi:hypothetical protein
MRLMKDFVRHCHSIDALLAVAFDGIGSLPLAQLDGLRKAHEAEVRVRHGRGGRGYVRGDRGLGVPRDSPLSAWCAMVHRRLWSSGGSGIAQGVRRARRGSGNVMRCVALVNSGYVRCDGARSRPALSSKPDDMRHATCADDSAWGGCACRPSCGCCLAAARLAPRGGIGAVTTIV